MKKNKKEQLNIDKGVYQMKDFLAPESLERGNTDHLKIGNQYVRNFILKGYPTEVYVGWLNDLYHNTDNDIDTCIHIEPSDDKAAIDALTTKITQFEAQYSMEREKGNIRNLTRLEDTISELYEERRKLERNTEKLFQVQTLFNLYADSKENLEKETQKIDNKLRGRRVMASPTYLRQDDGYLSTLPFAQSKITDQYRNFNSGALTACFPFYNSDIIHPNGVFCGINRTTLSPVMIDFYDRKLLESGNISVLGATGSGKTFFVSLLTLRSLLRGIRSVLIDPEGDYKKLTEAVNGSYIKLSPDSEECMNPFDIEEADVLDDDGYPTGLKTVSINDKVSDLLNLIQTMAGALEGGDRSTASSILQSLYFDRGITEDPKSLYITEPYFDAQSGIFYHAGMKKRMPQLSDFYNKLEETGTKNNDKGLIKLANSLKMFLHGGIYGMFDCQTAPSLQNFSDACLIDFDVSQLEENILRPIGMYIALSWTWEKFVKKHPEIKKRVVCDEAWMLVSTTKSGSAYTSEFLENAARRIRKRNAGLLVASQHFMEFTNSPQGQAVLKQSTTKIFLQQDSSDLDELQDTFKLSDGEKNFLATTTKGNMLVKTKHESATVTVIPFDYEKELIEKKTYTTN